MAELLLFHHAQGLTSGVLAFADELRAAGHVVHAPDLFEGRTFASLDEGIAHAQQVGFDTVIERGTAASAGLPEAQVHVGFSLGVLPAQLLAQTRPGTRAAVFFHSCVPPSELGGEWPAGVPLQIHIMENDPLALAPEADLETARELDATVVGAELFLYAGDRHLFADPSLPSYDEGAAKLATRRVVELLDALGQ